MGSRAVFGFAKSAGSEPIFLYGHWCGAERHELLINAVDTARPRWHDDSYATRICISQIIGNEWHGNLNWGLSAGHNSFAHPDFYDVPIVVWDEGYVHITDASDTTKPLAFIELADLDRDTLSEACRIAGEVRSASSDGRTVEDPQIVADIVMSLSEMRLVRAVLNDLAGEIDLRVALNDDGEPFPGDVVERVIAWLHGEVRT